LQSHFPREKDLVGLNTSVVTLLFYPICIFVFVVFLVSVVINMKTRNYCYINSCVNYHLLLFTEFFSTLRGYFNYVFTAIVNSKNAFYNKVNSICCFFLRFFFNINSKLRIFEKHSLNFDQKQSILLLTSFKMIANKNG